VFAIEELNLPLAWRALSDCSIAENSAAALLSKGKTSLNQGK